MALPCDTPAPCLPTQLHPKSFRAMFEYNTNVWASLGSRHMRRGPVVGVLPWEQDLAADYFPAQNQSWGMGMRQCAGISRHFAVVHRCR
jgi:hypothetical protein